METLIVAVGLFAAWWLWKKYRPKSLAPDPNAPPRFGGAPYLPAEDEGGDTVSPPGDRERAK